MASSVKSSVSLHQFVKSLESAPKKHSRIPAEFSDKSAVVELLLSSWLDGQSMPLKNKVKNVKKVSDSHFLDPFMGFGNLVTAANECGLNAVGVDINPVAWFWARYQHLNLDSAAFQNAIDRLLQRHTPDGQLLKNLIASLFHVKCPENSAHHAFQHRTFWYKFEQCQNPDCGKSVPLLESFIILQKRLSIPAYLDYQCPHCERNFDWELKKGVLCQPERFWVNAPFDSAGIGRENAMWAYGDTRVFCPFCKKIVEKNENKSKRVSKKIQLTALLCPFCFSLWQYRGPLPENVVCPGCGSGYNPKESYVREHNWYRCPDCGTIEKIRFGQLKSRPLIYEIYCDECRRDTGGPNLLRDGGGRILSRIEPENLAQLLRVSKLWGKWQQDLKIPTEEIVPGRFTQSLRKHRFFHWLQLYNSRQLLCAGLLLKAISEESDRQCQIALTAGFLEMVAGNSVLSSLDKKGRLQSLQVDEIPLQYVESIPLSEHPEEGSLSYYWKQVMREMPLPDMETTPTQEAAKCRLWCSSVPSLHVQKFLPQISVIASVLPMPADTRFLEFSDFQYSWLKNILGDHLSFFSPEHVMRIDDVNYTGYKRPSHKKYFQQLQRNLSKCVDVLPPKGRAFFLLPPVKLAFWKNMVETLFLAGFCIERVWLLPPKMADFSGPVTDDFFLILNCYRPEKDNGAPKFSMARLFDDIKKQCQTQLEVLKTNEFSAVKMNHEITWFLLQGEALNLAGKAFLSNRQQSGLMPFEKVYQLINIVIDWLLCPGLKIPESLLSCDPCSYFYLTYLCRDGEIRATKLEQLAIGICNVDELKEVGIVSEIKRGKERRYQINDPIGRYEQLRTRYAGFPRQESFQTDLFNGHINRDKSLDIPLVDMLHLALGLAFYGESVDPWLIHQEDLPQQIMETCHFLQKAGSPFVELIGNLLEKL